MSRDQHVTELLPAFALGCLDRDEEILASDHLANCPTCRAELQSYQSVADQLLLAAPDVAPRAELKAQLLAHIASQQPPSAQAQDPSWQEQPAGLWQRLAPGWSLVSLALILVLVISNLTLWLQEDRSGPQIRAMYVTTLSGTDAAPGATGTLVVSLDGEHGTLVVDGLPQLDENHQYQLWLIKDGQRTDGGLLDVSRSGYGALWVSSPDPLASYQSFGVTVEPAGGSPGPTGEKVLGGSL